MYFRNRTEAGHLLAQLLDRYKDRDDVVVLALPRGGVPVAYEVARELNAPLDIFIVRKLGAPGHEELAMGALASGGVRVLNDDVVRHLNISSAAIESATEREQRELERREHLYRGDRPSVPIHDRVVIIVDDGLATGSTMKAALEAIRRQKPSRLIVAVPTAPSETCEQLRKHADEVVCAITPEPFYAVGGSYGNFEQTTDDEVRDLINRRAA
jgi:putative phosphoribosyl transferase